jgi:hypothetical protein
MSMNSISAGKQIINIKEVSNELASAPQAEAGSST